MKPPWILVEIPIPFSDYIFGIGARWQGEVQMLVHVLIYMAIVWPGVYLISALSTILVSGFGVLRRGYFLKVTEIELSIALLCSWFASTFVELGQGVQYTYSPGNFFGLYDFVFTIGFSYLLYKVILWMRA